MAASCVRSFSLCNGTLLSRLDKACSQKPLLARVSFSASPLPCHDHCAISQTLSILALKSSSRTRRYPRISAVEAGPFDLDQTDTLESFNTEPSPDFEQQPVAPPPNTKLYVGNLPWSVDSEQLAQVFQDIGCNVEMVEVIYDRETGRSRGFAFVTMETEQDASTAIERLDGADYGGRRMRVSYPDRSRTGGSPPPRFGTSDSPFRVFVGNLPWSVDDASLEQICSQHGKVQDARVIFDRDTGRSRGFGFVTLSSEAEVNDAITYLDGSNVDGRSIRVNRASEKPPMRPPMGESFGEL